MSDSRMLSFEISLHPRPSSAAPGTAHADRLGDWPALTIPRDASGEPMAVGGDACLAAIARLDRAFVEPDGSFVWRGGAGWQVDGNVHERDGRVLLADLKGTCPEPAFDRLLEAFGWPGQPLAMQLVREGVWLDEQTFRRRAVAAFTADGTIGVQSEVPSKEKSP